MNARAELRTALEAAQPGVRVRDAGDRLLADVWPSAIPTIAMALVGQHACEFASMVAEVANTGFLVHYFFYSRDDGTLVELITCVPPGTELPAISDRVHAADWHEREVEDLFGIRFTGHPFLGDFVLHDRVWPENVAPMRHAFDARQRVAQPGLGAAWKPRRILDEEGAIQFPVGPIWADYNEAGLWLLGTPGEQIHAGQTRLFYKYRAVEKIVEGRVPTDAVLLAERFSGSAAFAHAWTLCMALEEVSGCVVPPRAQLLRIVFAELERIRYHAATLAELAGSTSLAVGKSMSQEIEEQMLQLSARTCGHRYLFGVCAPGGLARDCDAAVLAVLATGLGEAAREFAKLERRFVHTSSHLDRLEEMGTLRPEAADLYGVVGPVARASGRDVDLRRQLPYGAYAQYVPTVPREIEGDGYARMRVYFAEIRASTTLIQNVLASLPDGPIATQWDAVPGTALAWAEAPAGGTFHWLRLGEDGRIQRWRIAPPGFRNWHAFHRALEGAAFQDFHIIMASFGLSVAESDR